MTLTVRFEQDFQHNPAFVARDKKGIWRSFDSKTNQDAFSAALRMFHHDEIQSATRIDVHAAFVVLRGVE